VADPAELSAQLVSELTGTGDLVPEWRGTFGKVARHRFIPDTVWVQDGGLLLPVDRSADEGRWLELCYRNDFVITQVDDGVPSTPGRIGHEITSSASRPDVVAQMLAALEVEPGMSVLEIGTGTGWNAALLAERLGMLEPADARRQDALLGRLGLPLRAPGLDPASLWAPLRRDKKARQAGLRWVLLQRLGAATIRPDVPEPLVDDTLRVLTRRL
jgi:hypothetical protein